MRDTLNAHRDRQDLFRRPKPDVLGGSKLSPWGTVTVSTLRGRFLAYQGRIFNILPCTDQLA